MTRHAVSARGNLAIVYAYQRAFARAIELQRSVLASARRLEDGFPQWRNAGLPVSVGAGAGGRVVFEPRVQH